MPEKPNQLISIGLLFFLILQSNTGFTQKSGERIASATAAIQITTSVTPSRCGQKNGILLASVTGGTPPYTYSFNGAPFQSSALMLVNGPGTYSIVVKDATGATVNTTAAIRNTFTPVNVAVISNVPESRCSTSDGSVTLRGYNGTPPYTYSLDLINFQANNAFTNLTSGEYNFYIKDANGCINSVSTLVTSPNCIHPNSFLGSWTLYSCSNEGHIDITLASSSPYLTYSLDGINYQSSYHFTGLGPGLYKVHILDRDGTLYSLAVNIAYQCPFIVGATVTHASCGNSDGRIMTSVKNGTAPIQYSIDGVSFQNNPVFSWLSPGYYTLVAKDAAGLITTTTITIINVCLSLNLSTTDATCGNNNGTITANASNGTVPYTYSIDGTNFQSSNIFSGVSQGNYVITVKDVNGFSTTSPVSVGNIAGPQITTKAVAASCNNNDGTIIISGTSGTLPFLYTINNTNFQPDSNFNDLSTGNYIAIIKDANGCMTSLPVTIDLSNTLVIDAGDDITINEGTTATLKPTSNGTAYSWTPSAGLNNPSILTPDASPEVTTKYYITAQWGICENKDSVSVLVNPAPISDIFVPNAFTPNGDGRNDLFKAIPIGIRQFKYLAVYNRWGQRVFFTTNPAIGWNGTINGKIPQINTYVWMVAGINFKGKIVERRGTVALIR